MVIIVEGNPLNIIVTQYCEQYLGVMMFRWFPSYFCGVCLPVVIACNYLWSKSSEIKVPI